MSFRPSQKFTTKIISLQYIENHFMLKLYVYVLIRNDEKIFVFVPSSATRTVNFFIQSTNIAYFLRLNIINFNFKGGSWSTDLNGVQTWTGFNLKLSPSVFYFEPDLSLDPTWTNSIISYVGMIDNF